MLKTPPRLAGLGIALTMCAIGAGTAFNAVEAVEAVDFGIVELENETFEGHVIRIEFQAPAAPASIEASRVAAKRPRTSA